MHHGVDHDRFVGDRRPTRPTSPRSPRTASRPPYIAFASTIEPRKDVPDARARVRARRRRRDPTSGWCSPAPTAGARARHATRSRRAASATQILRPGYLDDATLAAFFRRAEVVAYPSLDEGFGLPALEALACGAPVVTATGSALAEVVGDAALLVPPADPSALADAIALVLDDPAVAARLRAAGPARAAHVHVGPLRRRNTSTRTDRAVEDRGIRA